jgi:peroxidase
MSLVGRDPFVDGTLNLVDNDVSIRTIDGSNNNLQLPSNGAAEVPFIRLASAEFEDGIQSPAGVAHDAAGNALPGIDGNAVQRQPIPIFTAAERDRLISQGYTVVNNTNNLSNVSNAPHVLLNPADRPSPRVISNAISGLKQGESLLNSGRLNALNWSFGQFVNHDSNYAAESADEENTNRIGSLNFGIDIPTDDPNFPLNTPPTPTISRQADGSLQFDFPRSGFVQGTGVPVENGTPVTGLVRNEVTHWLDLSAVYGSADNVAKQVRTFQGGFLKVFSNSTTALNDDLLPADEQKQTRGGFFQGVGFYAGDDRVSENDNLAAQQILWMRNHNRIALELSRYHSEWSDEQIYQRARQINIAQYQNVVMYEWLPLQIGNVVTAYQNYNQNLSGNVTDEFNVAGLRFGHSQTNNHIESVDANGNVTNIPLLTAFGAGHINSGSDVDSILRGDSQLVAEKIDTNVVFDLRNALFPPAGIGFDLFSANMQRGRDRGLADYNQVRASVGLERVTSFSQITSNPELAQTLENLYGTVEDIDLLVGLLAEDPVTSSGAGITFQKIVMEQFQRLRDADRFWFERSTSQGGFLTSEEIAEIKQTTFSDIIRLNTEITNLPESGFLVAGQDNPNSNEILNLNGFTGKATVAVSREAAYDNLIGFYVVADEQGTIVDPLTGKSLSPNQGLEYAKAAISNRVAEFRVDNLTTEKFNINLPAGTILAPYIIQNGDISQFEIGKAQAFFAFGAANQDGVSHILKLGNGSNNSYTFAFEDLFGTGVTGSDRDFNDMVIKVTLG